MQIRHTIDLKYDYPSNGLYARKLWEKLFRLVYAEKFQTLDSFLCDLKYFEQCFNDGYHQFYWGYNYNGVTWIKDYNPSPEKYYYINFDPKNQIIEIINENH